MLETRHIQETGLHWFSSTRSYCWESFEARNWASDRWLNGSRIEHITLRLGEPTTWGRSRRKYVARKDISCRHCRSDKHEHNSLRGTATCKVNPGDTTSQEALHCESEYNRGAGCGKTARPDLYGGHWVTDVPTISNS